MYAGTNDSGDVTKLGNVLFALAYLSNPGSKRKSGVPYGRALECAHRIAIVLVSCKADYIV